MTTPFPALGITPLPDGARLRVWSANATSMVCCLYSPDGELAGEVDLHPAGGDVWEATDARLTPGRLYALRVDGPVAPANRFDPQRPQLDPYGRHVVALGDERDPRWYSVVVADAPFQWSAPAPAIPLRDTVIYEAHTRGLTALAPFVPEPLRGTYAGLGHPATISLLTQLGVTAVELLPVQAFASERHLRTNGMRNYWGYNTLGFFAPHPGYATAESRAAGGEAIALELKTAIDALHAAGLEVILDVVYNHTADEDAMGAPVLFRGIDNASYYRTNDNGSLIDVTGCGNALDSSQPVVQQFVLDSLRYWRQSFQIDGFRFDLAPTLGRDADHRFTSEHPLLGAIAEDPILGEVKLIAEPWDVGIGGWQTGNFPEGWSEWNDEYRDRTRRFWVEDFAHSRRTGTHPEGVGKLTTAIAGSSNRFSNVRGPLASVNFVTAHDGFTLRDLVSYNVKHNLLNAEMDRDGTNDNRSYNFGWEGKTSDPAILAARRRASRNLLGTLLLSAGVPMITAGDESGRTQDGNNNAYTQDSARTWLRWTTEPEALDLHGHVQRLLAVRRAHPALRPTRYNHGRDLEQGSSRLTWFDALGGPMDDWEWNSPHTRSVQYLAETPLSEDDPDDIDRVLVIIHGVEEDAVFRLPTLDGIDHYELVWDSIAERVEDIDADAVSRTLAPARTVVISGPAIRVFRLHRTGTALAPRIS